jgi:hypothetical protein
MTRARDMANLGSQAGSGLDASDITSGVLPSGVTGGSGLTSLGTVTAGNLSNTAIVYPVGHIIQIKSSIYTGSGFTRSTSAGTIAQGELANFTAKNVSNKIIVNFWVSGIYTTNNNCGLSIGLRYSTDNFSSHEVTVGPSNFMAAYVNFGQGDRKESVMATTGLIDCPTSSEFDIRFYTQSTGGALTMNQDGSGLDTMGIIIYEIQD